MIENGQVSFTYATREIKSLLTIAGKILEIYVWHETKATGYFDDVVSNFEPSWKNFEASNEIDCLATRKFKTLLIECKARYEIKQDFYFKLSALAEKFGVNAIAVLIADTQEKENTSANNDVQRDRGSEMNIITVWKKDEINNIGKVLLKIINGDYQK